MHPARSALVNLLERLHAEITASTFRGDVDLVVVTSKDRFMNCLDFIARQSGWDKEKRKRLRKAEYYQFSNFVRLEWDEEEAAGHADRNSIVESMKEQ